MMYIRQSTLLLYVFFLGQFLPQVCLATQLEQSEKQLVNVCHRGFIGKEISFLLNSKCSEIKKEELSAIKVLQVGGEAMYKKELLLTEKSFVYMSSLEHLIFKNVQITIIPGNVFSTLGRLTHLSFDTTGTTQISKNAFSGLYSLLDLTIKNTDITYLDEQLFQDLFFLKKLNLYGNNIDNIHKRVFGSLYSLNELILRRNNISTLPNYGFNSLGNLTKLVLTNNDLTRFNATTFMGLTSLTSLRLSKLDLDFIGPYAFKNLPTLTNLSVGAHSFSPQAFSGLNSLQKLLVYTRDTNGAYQNHKDFGIPSAVDLLIIGN